MTDVQPRIEWLDDSTVSIDGFNFLVSADPRVYQYGLSDNERFLLLKDSPYLRECVGRFLTAAHRNVVELGIWQGGSVVFWNLALKPERQLAIDLWDRSVEPLAMFVHGDQHHGKLDVRFGIDQADPAALEQAIDKTFGDEPLDIVIDDASHAYPETRSSFETVFPRMRPGGTYVIEDWPWAHSEDMSWDATGFTRDRPSLGNLIVELMLVCGADSGIIDDIQITPRAVHVRRGSTPIDGPFRLSSHYFNRGLPYRPLL